MKKKAAVVLLLVVRVCGAGSILVPGQYGYQDLPNKTPDPWVCLTASGLQKCSVTVKKERSKGDACLDTLGTVTTDVPDTQYLLRGVAGLKLGPVKSLVSEIIDLFEQKSVELKKGLVLETEVKFEKSNEGVPYPSDYQLFMRVGEKRIAIHTHQKQLDDSTPKLFWAGDLNGDGMADLIVDAYAKYSARTRELILSRKTGNSFRWVSEAFQIIATAC